jgi:hypothetical protein
MKTSLLAITLLSLIGGGEMAAADLSTTISPPTGNLFFRLSYP